MEKIIFSILSMIFLFLFIFSENVSAIPAPSLNLSTVDLQFASLEYKIYFITSINSTNYWNVNLSGTLRNNGNSLALSSGTSMNICRNYVIGGSCFGQLILTPSISPGGNTRVVGNFIGYTGQYSIGFRADTLNIISESNETNNQIGRTIKLR